MERFEPAGQLGASSASLTDDREWVERENRTVMTLLVARIIKADGSDGLCRIRNMSTGGMMLETDLPLAQNEAASVELKNGDVVQVSIRWTAGGRAGTQFLTPGAAERLTAHTRTHGNGILRRTPAQKLPRLPRFECDCPATVHQFGRSIPVHLANISLSGAKVAVPGGADLGELVRIAIRGLEPREAAVRWRRDGEAGLSFVQVLPYRTLSEWLAQHRRDASAPR